MDEDVASALVTDLGPVTCFSRHAGVSVQPPAVARPGWCAFGLLPMLSVSQFPAASSHWN